MEPIRSYPLRSDRIRMDRTRPLPVCLPSAARPGPPGVELPLRRLSPEPPRPAGLCLRQRLGGFRAARNNCRGIKLVQSRKSNPTRPQPYTNTSLNGQLHARRVLDLVNSPPARTFVLIAQPRITCRLRNSKLLFKKHCQ